MARQFNGVVVSSKMDKTVVVEVKRLKEHPLYRKQYHITRKYLAHDPENTYKVGDAVRISETRPLSKRKRWLVEKVLDKTEAGEAS